MPQKLGLQQISEFQLNPRASAALLLALLTATLLLANPLINSATKQSTGKIGYTELAFANLPEARSGFQPGATVTFVLTNHFHSQKSYHWSTTVTPALGSQTPGPSGDITLAANASTEVALIPVGPGKLRISLGGNLTLSTTLLDPSVKK